MFDILIKGGKIVDGTGTGQRAGDVAIKDGLIAAIGEINEPAKKVIEAAGLFVTPGFIDVHTHYDGQATWDSQLDPSFSTGITTAIMGNCGVGFAPVRPGDHDRLIDLMESVEEIPGTALHEGLKWNWSSFPEYLDVLEGPRSFDVGVLVPHGPLRRFVMGDKVGTDKCASGEELERMAAIMDEAMQAGAFGMSSSRTTVHRTLDGGMTDDFNVDEPELEALVSTVARNGGYVEFIPLGAAGEDLAGLKSEMAMYSRIVERTKATMHLAVVQVDNYPELCFDQLRWAEDVNNSGNGKVYAQVSGRSIAVMLSFYGINPFMGRPTIDKIKSSFPRAEWLEQFARPEIKEAILGERSLPGSFGEYVCSFMNRCYDMGDPLDYEPDGSRSVTRMAEQAGREPADLLYDLMVNTSNHPQIMISMNNYKHEDLDDVRKMLESPAAVLGLSDAGAHVQSVCDGSIYPFMLVHWVRDRKRGKRMKIEEAVKLMTKDSADAVGLSDRGVLEVGRKADINVFDLDKMTLHAPRFFDDLPTGAPRLMQRVTGFKATIVNGVVTREDDEATGQLPGNLIRFKGAPKHEADRIREGAPA